ncbi:FTR1 family iron permease [Paracandidimonas lactea]|uniref:FTR1 family iron permease n=1 Tax=Paracandidimonas lactea TaxID=2895524 RepID=UPI001F0138EE|nr:FTR1 family protein [Paracandidimonas lactea]
MEQQIAFIVWRESIEAMLVVGILFTWLRASPEGRKGLPWLWAGVAAGLGLAVLLALVLLGISSWLSDTGQEWFQAIMALAACALIVQMVYWMRLHGRTLKRELEQGASRDLEADNWWGLLTLVAIAVAREGSETVVFLYGSIAAGAAQGSAVRLALAGALGFGAALLSFWLLQAGGRLITWRRFFKLTEIMLLLLAGALLVSGMDHLISLDALPTLVDPVWDTSALLDTQGGLGKVLADFAGYRAVPSLTQVLLWALYWVVAIVVLKRVDVSAGRARVASGGARA